MREIMGEYGNSGQVAWVYRHFPIPQLHPKAPKEAEALECAAEQGGNDMFWAFADMVYDRTTANNSLDIGIYNTPATVPVNPQTGEPYYIQTEPTSETDAGQLSDIALELGLDVPTFEACIQSGRMADRINTDYGEVQAAGGGGTPHNILIVDGEQYAVAGALPHEMMKQLVDMILAADDLSRKDMEQMIDSFLRGA
jgi:protein-disulfide isomerase